MRKSESRLQNACDRDGKLGWKAAIVLIDRLTGYFERHGDLELPVRPLADAAGIAQLDPYIVGSERNPLIGVDGAVPEVGDRGTPSLVIGRDRPLPPVVGRAHQFGDLGLRRRRNGGERECKDRVPHVTTPSLRIISQKRFPAKLRCFGSVAAGKGWETDIKASGTSPRSGYSVAPVSDEQPDDQQHQTEALHEPVARLKTDTDNHGSAPPLGVKALSARLSGDKPFLVMKKIQKPKYISSYSETSRQK